MVKFGLEILTGCCHSRHGKIDKNGGISRTRDLRGTDPGTFLRPIRKKAARRVTIGYLLFASHFFFLRVFTTIIFMKILVFKNI